MNWKFLVLAFWGATVSLSAQDVALFSVHAPRFLDDPNPFRYSPLGVVDDDPSTVFAVSAGALTSPQPLFSIDLSRPADIDGLRLQPGYFDSRYFSKNDRLRTVAVVVRSADKSIPNREFSFPLEDKMEAQALAFGEKLRVAGIDVFVKAVYPGSSWNDIVVGDLRLLSQGQALTAGFRHEPMDSTGALVWSQEDTRIRYDAMKRPVEETRNYHKMGYETTWSTYNPEGLLVFQTHRTVDPDAVTDTSEVFFYRPEAVQPYRSQLFQADGTPDGEGTFVYQGTQRVKETKTGSRPTTKTWTYKDNRLVALEVRSKTMSGDDLTEQTEYFFKGTAPTGERITKTFQGKKSVCLYQYVPGPPVGFKVPVQDSPDWSFSAQMLRYDGTLLVSTVSSDFGVF